jgi:sugar-specific transcriptional regulator TrmB/DNA-binding CsgD family transcriptional regulator
MSLRDLGFDPVQENVYRGLLADPQCDVAALAALARTSAEAVRGALAGLVELGVAEVSASAPSGVTPGDPEVAIGELIERLEHEMLRRQRDIGGTRAELSGLTALRNRLRQDGPSVEVELVSDPEQVRERLAELCFFTRSSVCSVQPARSTSAVARQEASRLDSRSLRRGVDMRIIYDTSLLREERNRARLGERAAAGARIRVRPGPLRRLIVLDERVAVVPVDQADSLRGALIVRQPGLVRELSARFTQQWEEATDLHDAGATASGEPADGDCAVLRMLAAGMTDELVARRVGVSVRHLRRRIARLMEQLEATSRFQAGATAARRGWI